jgi:hypothetical protein
MKTDEEVLKQWVTDEIVFDYCDGRGPLIHTRDQLAEVCHYFNPSALVTESESGMLSTGCVSTGLVTPPSQRTGPINPVPSGAIGCGMIQHAAYPSGHVGSGAVVCSSAPNVGMYAEERERQRKIVNWGVLSRVDAAVKTCMSLLEKQVGSPDHEVIRMMRLIINPRGIAKYENARELIRSFVEMGLRGMVLNDVLRS